MRLWSNRDYMLLWAGQVSSVLGSSSVSKVYPLLILVVTGSATQAGVAAALQALPYLLFSLPAGALIDRWDRKRVMIVCDLGRCLATSSIAVAIAANALSIWHIYAVALVNGSLFVFSANQSLRMHGLAKGRSAG
jgi:MFS family permease